MDDSSHPLPVATLHLFPVLDKLLMELLRSLSPEQWKLPTIARQWTVKDIAAHLLDGNLRGLSFSRDAYFGEAPEGIDSYQALVGYLNQLNDLWVRAGRRLSSKVLIDLLEITGRQYHEHLLSLDPHAQAVFAVAWAGEDKSPNWFHIAREYTEKFIHQQQIREAVGQQALFTRELFFPFMDTLMYALPVTYQALEAPDGTVVTLHVQGEIGGYWSITKTASAWELSRENPETPQALLRIAPEDAWKLFSKGMSPEQAEKKVEISGDSRLAKVALNMLSVIA